MDEHATRSPHEIEGQLLAWLGTLDIDPGTGQPPDVKVAARASYVTTWGHLRPGATEPDDGEQWWLGTLTLYFREQGPPDEPYDVGLYIARVLDPIEDAIAEDPTLGGRFAHVEWRGTDGTEPTQPVGAPDGYPEAVEAYLGITR